MFIFSLGIMGEYSKLSFNIMIKILISTFQYTVLYVIIVLTKVVYEEVC